METEQARFDAKQPPARARIARKLTKMPTAPDLTTISEALAGQRGDDQRRIAASIVKNAE
jgi:hypothetical protein